MEEMDFNPEIFTLTDEEGVEHEFELMDVMEVDGNTYYALVPYSEDPEAALEEDTELVILKAGADDDGVDFLTTIDNDEEYDRIGNMFIDRISQMLEEDFEEEEEA
ncbi:MAG: DUF1292 domain-containing protein [Oscillospiraceae bacterium]|nr:DUF1292 domain-containing protein [Ruminococcus sp.]MBQ7003612.1 DUF1292 domain-containing protein [Oscillospiraceae bacterium]MBQ7013924.1 DUF1292 domain-containing protein [Oscillospiraceae bacterium]